MQITAFSSKDVEKDWFGEEDGLYRKIMRWKLKQTRAMKKTSYASTREKNSCNTNLPTPEEWLLKL